MEAIKRQAAQDLGARLRIIRKSQKMSLQEVEKRSHGHWKAVVIGSYERADRALSVGKLAELLHFYQVPISSCFSMPSTDKAEIRELIGAKPLAVVTDFHANMTQERLKSATIWSGYRTNPHIDTYEAAVRSLENLFFQTRRTYFAI